jgi:NAD(P)-dependent dehydrogenase (short-subunit alcohol dehydrogenase family)
MADPEPEVDGRLTGRRALVIGAGTPGGRAAAVALAAAGADVAVAAGSIDGDEVMAVRRARRQIEALGRRTAEYAMDLSLGANVRVSVRQVAKELGGLDILVNAADAYLRKDSDAISDAEWARAMSVNLTGVFYACRAAVKEMTSGGAIINVCPWIAEPWSARSSAYLAARHGVVGLSHALAAEYAPRGIRVAAILVDVTADLDGVIPFSALPASAGVDALGRLVVLTASADRTAEVVLRLRDSGDAKAAG